MNSARERLHYPCAGYNVATVAGNSASIYWS